MDKKAVGLTVQEQTMYQQEGLVKPAYRLSDTAITNMQILAEQTLIATTGQAPESIVCPYLPGWNGLPETITEQWLAIAGIPEIVEYVASILGPDIILWGGQFFCKPATTGLEVPWHQDGEYWPILPLQTCSVWLAIDDATAENGCMRYIPGSQQKGEIFPHREDTREALVLNQVTENAYFDATTAKDDILRAGEFSLHDVFLIHGSEPNRSAARRAAYVLRFMPAASLWDRTTNKESGSAHYQTHFSTRPIFLMRGEAGENTELITPHPRYS